MLGLLLALTCCACAHIPKNRYGIDKLSFVGMNDLDPNALRACLATEQRDKVTLGLGALGGPSCGEPPFDRYRRAARLFAMPWADWPVYDEAIFKLDLERIERWYQARGYYGVRVLDVTFNPSRARITDACPSDEQDDEACELEIEVRIEEGDPIHVRKVELVVEGKLDPKLRDRIYRAISPEEGDVWDEAIYDEAREKLGDVLREAGYARTAVAGDVTINRGLMVADIKFTITPGPICYFGEVRIESKQKLPHEPILAATLLEKGQLYQKSALDDAQRAIYKLGAFSAVTVRGEVDEYPDRNEIPVVITVEPRRESEILVGGGVLSGISGGGVAAMEGISVPQWDVHLIGSYENRNFFGGLRRFRIEERPRMLFLEQFPATPTPRFGNLISADFSQPGVIDGRTRLFVEARWDNGPDPFLLFFRNDVGIALGLERSFWHQRINLRGAIHQEFLFVANRQPITNQLTDELNDRWARRYAENGMNSFQITDRQAALLEEQKSYVLPFIEQQLTLDLRDDPIKPTLGGYFRITAHEAFRYPNTPSWNYIRLTPEVRGYVPLGLGMVFAARFAIGWLHVFDYSSKLDQTSQTLGAQTWRLRGGGAVSNRGFSAGRLGDGLTGGTHRWEASGEWRIPLSRDFWIVGFMDMGDVNSGLTIDRTYTGQEVTANTFRYEKGDDGFRFNHLNTSVGGGLRYYTIIGPVRLDIAYRPKALAGDSTDNTRMDLGFAKFRGGVHLTIGDSF